MHKKILISALASVMAIMGLAGCSQEAREKYDAAGDRIESGAKATADAAATDAAKTGDAIEKGAEQAGEAVEDAGQKVAGEVDESQTTLAVKNALLSAKDLETMDLNVDTQNKTVFLRGSVADESQKSRAESIAKGIVAKDYTVKNELTVGGAAGAASGGNR